MASWQSVDFCLTVDWLLADYWPTVSQMSVSGQSTVGWMLVDCWLAVGWLLADCQSNVSQLSVDCYSTATKSLGTSLFTQIVVFVFTSYSPPSIQCYNVRPSATPNQVDRAIEDWWLVTSLQETRVARIVFTVLTTAVLHVTAGIVNRLISPFPKQKFRSHKLAVRFPGS